MYTETLPGVLGNRGTSKKGIYFMGTWEQRLTFEGNRGTKTILVGVNPQIVRSQGFFSGVSEAVIRPLSQWQMPTFFPNLDQKIPNQSESEGNFYVNQ